MQQRKQALSRFIETLRLDERRPIVTIENGDALALVKEELARQKTDLLVLGTYSDPAWSTRRQEAQRRPLLDRAYVTYFSLGNVAAILNQLRWPKSLPQNWHGNQHGLELLGRSLGRT